MYLSKKPLETELDCQNEACEKVSLESTQKFHRFEKAHGPVKSILPLGRLKRMDFEGGFGYVLLFFKNKTISMQIFKISDFDYVEIND